VLDGRCHPPDSGIMLQCWAKCPTLVFVNYSVIDTMLDWLTDTPSPRCSTLNALNVVVAPAEIVQADTERAEIDSVY
jgi:hypothetical protein